MRIVVAILTRENPIGLTTLVGALHALESKNHQVRYVIRYDEDDIESQDAVNRLARANIPVEPVCRDRPLAPATGWNDAMQAAGKWDICSTLPDDVIPLADRWDDMLAGTMTEHHPVVSWTQNCDPNNPVFPAFRREWFEALDGDVFPNLFPFWFADTWIVEVHQLALGSPLPIVRNLCLGGSHGPTRGMRDLSWWFDFFGKTRPARLQEAKRLAKVMGRQQQGTPSVLAKMAQTDVWQQGRVPMYEQAFKANQGQPSERYLAAKRQAEEYV